MFVYQQSNHLFLSPFMSIIFCFSLSILLPPFSSPPPLLPFSAHCPSEHRYRERLLGQFLAWLLESYVLGLVKAMFYVTESMGQKHALRFYRREVWNKLQTLAFRCRMLCALP